MKKLLLICSLFLTSYFLQAQMAVGDIAFIGYNTDVSDNFAFITLNSIPANEVIFFTEEGWNTVGIGSWAGTTEGHIKYTAPAAGLPCGTVVHINETGISTFTIECNVSGATATLESGASWSLTGGDQVLAYQAATAEPVTTPTFISGVNGDDGNGTPLALDNTTKWNDPTVAPLGTARSALPTGLTNGTNCVSLFPSIGTEKDNAKYIGTLTGTAAAIRAQINDYTNWSHDNNTPFAITPSNYSPNITCPPPCTNPDVPSLSSAPGTICSGNSALLSISGNKNDATEWKVYTGSCGGTLVATVTGSSTIVTPNSTGTTTYYVRGEGGCVTPGSCASIDITVTPREDASFSYDAAAYCIDAADPTPTITGVSGGNFSSATGLSINTNTGTVDLSASTPGTYTISYNTLGLCDGTESFSITVNAIDDASFSYSSANYAINDTDPTPTITGIAGGTFSSTAGLSINASTGEIDLSASTIATYTVTYTTTGTCSNSSTTNVTIQSPPVYTWTGAFNNTWGISLNWSTNVVPTTNANIIIPNGLTNYPTATSAVTFNNLTINSGASFIPQSSVTGTITYKRNITDTNWHLISSPVAGETLQNIISNTTFATGTGSNIGIGFYSNTIGAPWLYAQLGISGAVTPGIGLSVKLATATDLSITGTINTTPVNYGIATGSRNNFNLIGNPFTAFVNSATFAATNTSLLSEETIWVWNGTSYTTYNNVSPVEIAPGQGFFVEAASNGNVTFATSNQSHQNSDTFMRQAPKPSFELFVQNNEDKKSTKVFYVENKTKGFDNGYDSKIFDGVASDFSVFTELLANNEGKKLAIQTLPNADLENMVIPVGVKAAAGKKMIFSLNATNFSTDIKLFLEDRETNTFTRLDKAKSTYKITLNEALSGTGRFYIHTTAQKSLSVDKNVALENVSIYKLDNANLRITGLPKGASTITMYSVLGKQVMKSSFNSTGVKDISLPQLSKGIYLVKLETENGKLNKKIILE